MKQKRPNRRDLIETISHEADLQYKNLVVHEALWQERWSSAANPFIAWKDWMTPAFCAIRAKVENPYIVAVRAREDAKRGIFK
jgi:hypothetical protein